MTPVAGQCAGAVGTDNVIVYTSRVTSLGLLMMAATNSGICFVQFGDDEAALIASLSAEFPGAEIAASPALAAPDLPQWINAVHRQIDAGAPGPDLPLDVRGTAFQRQVWQCLQRIPAGEALSYREVAQRIGRPSAVRAVASACARNRVAVLVPCHRVVRQDGGLGGYRWGLERKRALLAMEGRRQA